MADYKENWKKRVVYMLLGIFSFYFASIPIVIIFQIILPHDSAMMWSVFVFTFLRFPLLVIFLYMALIHVKPSLIPQQKKYHRLIVLALVLIPILAILFQSGYVIPELEPGFCTVSSGTLSRDNFENKGRMISFGVHSELECIEQCKNTMRAYQGAVNSCEFTGTYGKTHWQKTSLDFDDIGEKIRFGGVK